MENTQGAENYACHDCGRSLETEGQEIKNGVFLVYDDAGEKINVLKCKDCFGKNPSLENFRECEVYSRVVGYIRPVQQWHKGKRQEYGEREEFILPETGSCC